MHNYRSFRLFLIGFSWAIFTPWLALAQASKDSITYKNLVFEGAGIRGLAYCGALMEMNDRGLLDSVERVAGTSSGAITATLLAVGYSPQEVFDIISSTNFAKFNDGGGFFVGGLIRLNRRMGYYKGKSFTRWMCHLLESKMGNGNLTFSELHYLKLKNPHQYRDLIITATCMNHQKPEFFSWTSYPQMSVVDAVRASMAVPLYYEPLVMDDNGTLVDIRDYKEGKHHILLDGGFLSNYPIQAFDDSTLYHCSLNQTLGFRIDSDYQIQVDRTKTKLPPYYSIHSTVDLVGSIYYIMKENLNRFMLTEYDWHRTVSISDCNIGPKVKKLSVAQKRLFIEAGRQGFKNYMDVPGFQ